MEQTHFPVIIIGGGQAGLSMSYCLKQQGIDHVIFERHQLGWAWRTQRWDSFCLVTPNWQCRLPGFPYDGDDPDGFMANSDIVDYLERYASSFAPPLLTGINVERVGRDAGGYTLRTGRGTFTARHVVVAVGNYHRRRFPALAARVPGRIHQLHSADYRSPAALPEGAVLVVGSAQSGAQIAEDLHLAGRRVYLCVGSAPRVSRFYRGRDVVAWLEDMGHYRLTVDSHPQGEDARRKTNHYVTGRDGGRDIDLRLFAGQGMRLHGRLLDLDQRNGVLITGDDLAANLDNADDTARRIKESIDKWIATQGIDAPEEPPYLPMWFPEPGQGAIPLDSLAAIVWAVGFHTDFSWIDAPVFDGQGYPRHRRGVAVEEGIYFLGLPWLWTWGSGRFEGVGYDAEYLARHIAGRITAPASKAARYIAR